MRGRLAPPGRFSRTYLREPGLAHLVGVLSASAPPDATWANVGETMASRADRHAYGALGDAAGAISGLAWTVTSRAVCGVVRCPSTHPIPSTGSASLRPDAASPCRNAMPHNLDTPERTPADRTTA